MTNIPDKLLKTLMGLNPVSIMVTGSAGSGEAGKKSDIDVAVIFKDRGYIPRTKLKKFTTNKVRIYPFRLGEIKKKKALHPFPIRFYFWWLLYNSKVVYGKNVMTSGFHPTKNDFKEVLSFERGVALSAMHSLRNKDNETARISFVKSCLFGVVAGIGLLGKSPPKNFTDATGKGAGVYPKYSSLIRRANRIRRNGGRITEQDVFENIEFLHHLALSRYE